MPSGKSVALGVPGNQLGNLRYLTLTCTTTGAETLTIQGLTIATGKTARVDWGDGQSNTYTAGAGTRTHAYAGAGAYTVRISNPENITLLDLRDAKLSGTINAANPLPANLTSLTLSVLPSLNYNANTAPLPVGLTSLTIVNIGLTYNANTNSLPAGLTSLQFNTLTGLTYNANTNPLPAGLTSLQLVGCPNLTWTPDALSMPAGVQTLTLIAMTNLTPVTYWAVNSFRTLRYENSLTQAQVDAVVNAIWLNKANYTFALPTLDIAGTGNASPSGTYQAANPPATGKEKIYDLVNGNYTPAGPEWSVTYT
jgi:hypothetical protein